MPTAVNDNDDQVDISLSGMMSRDESTPQPYLDLEPRWRRHAHDVIPLCLLLGMYPLKNSMGDMPSDGYLT